MTKHNQENLDKIFSIQSKRLVKNDFTIQFKNIWYQLDEIQPTTIYRKDEVLVEERLNGSIHLSKKDKYLNFKKLPARPEKIKAVLAAITPRKAPYVPSANNPWKRQMAAQWRQRQLAHNSNVSQV